LNEQVKRNIDRFPSDFMFQMNVKEHDSLRSQFATLKHGRGQHRKYLPYVFTEHGAILSALCRSASMWCAPLCNCVRCCHRTKRLRAN
jgi:hypothetical protein